MDKQFYPSYLCGNVIRSEVLEEHPELAGVFEKLTGLISDSEMAKMNDEVETKGREPRDVAEEFLQDNGLFAVRRRKDAGRSLNFSMYKKDTVTRWLSMILICDRKREFVTIVGSSGCGKPRR